MRNAFRIGVERSSDVFTFCDPSFRAPSRASVVSCHAPSSAFEHAWSPPMHIIASNGRFLTAESGGGLNGDPARGPARNDALVADRTAADLARFGDAWQQF